MCHSQMRCVCRFVAVPLKCIFVYIFVGCFSFCICSWLYLFVHGCICLFMVVFVCSWLYLFVHGYMVNMSFFFIAFVSFQAASTAVEVV